MTLKASIPDDRGVGKFNNLIKYIDGLLTKIQEFQVDTV